MNLKIFLYHLALAFFIFSCSTTAKIPKDYLSGPLSKDIKYLSSDDLKGRATGSAGEALAADYIATRFKNIGATPMGTENYYQKFTGYDSPNGHGDMPIDKIPVPGKNVVAFMDNNAPYTVVIGAHYDHLGMGGFGSLYEGPAEIHNGADDNASGVAVMLLLAESLKTVGPNNVNFLFIAFSGEEKGLWGSNYWTKNPTYPLEKITYMINLDMVGRFDGKRLAINGTGTSPAWTALDEINKQKWELIKSESGIGPSDHSSFYLSDIPAIHFFTGQHEDYHKPSDDFEKVNLKGCYEVSAFILKLINKVGSDKLEFSKTKDESTEVVDFKVTLGVIPDYMYQGEGMRIDGVREGKTASDSGILKGDIVLKMGDIDVIDMTTYMKALGAFEKGQTIPVVINRNEKTIEVQVTFK